MKHRKFMIIHDWQITNPREHFRVGAAIYKPIFQLGGYILAIKTKMGAY